QPATHDNIRVTLGQATKGDFSLQQQSTVLETVTVSAATSAVINPTRYGTGTTVSDSALRRLPTLNRNFADFVSLVPQVSTVTGFLSGGGVNVRQNAIQIDGAAAGDQFGLGTTGQPGSQANAKSIPLDAVKEYQVLLSPFDIRQGNFGGLLINAITKSGTNDFHGSVYGYTRNQQLTRKEDYLTNVFARIDANLPFSTRLVLRHNYASADNTSFSRANPATSAQPNFNLTSNEYQFSNTTHSTVAELLTNAKNGMYNELLFNYTT